MNFRLLLWLLGAFAINPTATALSDELVSALPPAARSSSPSGPSGTAQISSDGQFVFFMSTAPNVVTNVTPPFQLNLFRRNLQDNSIEILNQNNFSQTNQAGNGHVREYAISRNGQQVAFVTTARLADRDLNPYLDIYLRDLISGSTELISASAFGTVGNGDSDEPIFSADGRFVAFSSAASNLARYDSSTLINRDVFLRDLQTKSNTMVSMGPRNIAQATVSTAVAISQDASYVLFTGVGTNLVVTTAATPLSQVYLRDMIAEETWWISTNALAILRRSAPNAPRAEAAFPSLTPDGSYVIYRASDPVSGLTAALRHHILSNVTEVISTNLAASTNLDVNDVGPVMSADGRFVVYSTGAQLLSWNAQTRAITPVAEVAPTLRVDRPVPGADGRFIAFLMYPTNSGPAVASMQRRDMQSTQFEMVARMLDGQPAPISTGTGPLMSSNGERIVFESQSPGVVPDDHNQDEDVFMWEGANVPIRLISEVDPTRLSETPSGNSMVEGNAMTADGRYLVFSSDAPGLVPGEVHFARDLFLRDLTLGTNFLITRTANASTNPFVRFATMARELPIVSFSSSIANLAPHKTTTLEDVFVYDHRAGSNILVSVSVDQSRGGDRASLRSSISANGRMVVFESAARNLVTNKSTLHSDIFVRDVEAGATVRASVSNNGTEGDGPSQFAVISPGGRYVAFMSKARNLDTLANGSWGIHIHDLQQRRTWAAVIGYALPSATHQLTDSHLYYILGGALRSYNLQNRSTQIISPGVNAFSMADGGLRFALEMDSSGGARSVQLLDRSEAVPTPTRTPIQPAAPGTHWHGTHPVISADGRYVAYQARSTNANYRFNQVYLYDSLAKKSRLISASRPGQRANSLSAYPYLNRRGQFLVYQSFASDLEPLDQNQAADVFLHRVSTRDSDMDQLDDQWEVAYFGNLQRSGLEDDDGDGRTTREEFEAGTSPINDASVLHVTMTELATGYDLILSWPSELNRFYRVQYALNLEGAWRDMGPEQAGTGQTLTFNTTNIADPYKFYRVVVKFQE